LVITTFLGLADPGMNQKGCDHQAVQVALPQREAKIILF